jgi:Cation transporter/ATPase, N-terminus
MSGGTRAKSHGHPRLRTRAHHDLGGPPTRATSSRPLDLRSAATMGAAAVVAALSSTPDGLSSAEAARRLNEVGPNALVSHGTRPLTILLNQLRNPLLIPFVSTAVVSAFVGERTDAIIIISIIALTVGLGFVNRVPLGTGGRGAAFAVTPQGGHPPPRTNHSKRVTTSHPCERQAARVTPLIKETA